MGNIRIVFDGGPGPVAGRFVEVERDGKSISWGDWTRYGEDHPERWALEVPDDAATIAGLGRELVARLEDLEAAKARIAQLEGELTQAHEMVGNLSAGNSALANLVSPHDGETYAAAAARLISASWDQLARPTGVADDGSPHPSPMEGGYTLPTAIKRVLGYWRSGWPALISADMGAQLRRQKPIMEAFDRIAAEVGYRGATSAEQISHVVRAVKNRDGSHRKLDHYMTAYAKALGTKCEHTQILAAIVALTDALARVKSNQDYQRACETIAKMHAAAIGVEGHGPIRGVVEDIEDLRKEYLANASALGEIMYALGTSSHLSMMLSRIEALKTASSSVAAIRSERDALLQKIAKATAVLVPHVVIGTADGAVGGGVNLSNERRAPSIDSPPHWVLHGKRIDDPLKPQ